MERHHPARQPGETILIDKVVHDLVHEGERDAVRKIMQQDGLHGNPGGWTSKRIP